ncbi:MAG: superoxide dismutase family protein [Ginsengibacter sp.]|jgi:Cu-Zn family superoxide dismutase
MKLSKILKNASFAFVFITSSYLMSCNNAQTSEKNKDSVTTMNSAKDSSVVGLADGHAEATLSGTSADTTVEGKATFDVVGSKVKLELNITIPKKANQSVAVHLHEHGACGDMGKDAHGHWNPTNQQHGKWGSSSFHLGDIGNVTLDASGKGHLEMETDLWTIGGDSTSNILGRAVIVHGGVDDFKTQPTGNAGSRIGCGVIQ